MDRWGDHGGRWGISESRYHHHSRGVKIIHSCFEIIYGWFCALCTPTWRHFKSCNSSTHWLVTSAGLDMRANREVKYVTDDQQGGWWGWRWRKSRNVCCFSWVATSKGKLLAGEVKKETNLRLGLVSLLTLRHHQSSPLLDAQTCCQWHREKPIMLLLV